MHALSYVHAFSDVWIPALCAVQVPFWPGHDAAQFWGNLAGDVAWTVEAAVMLVVPALIARIRAEAKAKVE